MKAVLFRRFGGTDVLEWTDTENPRPMREIAAAHAASATGRVRGKIAIALP